MRVLVCGSRRFANPDPELKNPHWQRQETMLWTILQGIYEIQAIGWLLTHLDPLVIIDGGAPGADTAAHKWATTPGPHPGVMGTDDEMAVLTERYPADWEQYGRRAGFVRNKQMLDQGKPDLVIAFYDDGCRTRGTAMMVDLARKAEVETWEMYA